VMDPADVIQFVIGYSSKKKRHGIFQLPPWDLVNKAKTQILETDIQGFPVTSFHVPMYHCRKCPCQTKKK
jgi:hypothetical protein